jgi:hypothetical protein
MVVAPPKIRTLPAYYHALGAAVIAGDWGAFRAVAREGVNSETKSFYDGTGEYYDALHDAVNGMTDNTREHVRKNKNLKGDRLKKYLALVVAAELQMAVTRVVRRVATGEVERITHPELGKVCDRCRELEGTHDPDEEDLYWSHPNCHCEFRPVYRLRFSNLTSTVPNQIIGRGMDMTTTASFGKYDKATRQEFVKKGWALPDEESGGAFPIKDRGDLEDALHRIGTTNHPHKQVVDFLRKRAKELGAEDMLGDKTAPKASHGVTMRMRDTALFGKTKTLDENGFVVRRGKVFEAGTRLDMHGLPFVTTQADLNQMVLNFEKPIPVGSGHPEAPSPLDGHLGVVTNLYLGRKPTDLYAEAHIPPFVDEILSSKGEGSVSMVFNRHTKEPLGLDFVSDPNVVDAALFASFARNRHDTPEGQMFMQNMHDACAKRGAVCKKPDSSKHASGHEQSAVQQVHDICSDHGARCSKVGFANKRRGSTMNWTAVKDRDWKAVFTGLFQAVDEIDTAKMAGDDPSDDFEANWQEDKSMGSFPEVSEHPDLYNSNWNEDTDGDADGDYDSEEDEDEADADFHPAPLTNANPEENPVPGTGGEWSTNAMARDNTVDPNDVAQKTLMARNLQLEADLARERAHRIESEAVAFAKGEIDSNRSLVAEREGLIELYAQAAADDAVIGEVKMAGGTTTSRTERLKSIFGARAEHWMTKELLATSLSPEVIAAAQETARASFNGVKPMDAARKAELLGMSELGNMVKANAAKSQAK